MRKLQVFAYQQPLTTFEETENMSEFINWIDAMSDEDKQSLTFEVVEEE